LQPSVPKIVVNIKNANMFFIVDADKTSLETDKTRGLVESKALNSSFEV